MFDIFGVHGLVVALVALVVIGPKDLPKAMRVAGYWVGKARGIARQFRSGFDEMVREAELAEMEKKWKEENERIMREHPAPADLHDAADPVGSPSPVMTPLPPEEPIGQPVHVERPVLTDAPPTAADAASRDDRGVAAS